MDLPAHPKDLATSDRIAAAADSAVVTMYSTSFCGYCDRARALLTRKGAQVKEVKVDEDPAERATMLQRAGGRRTVPQIFIGDRHVGGYEELVQLDRSGELDRLLK